MDDIGELTQKNKKMAEILSNHVKVFSKPRKASDSRNQNDDVMMANNIPELDIAEGELIKAINEVITNCSLRTRWFSSNIYETMQRRAGKTSCYPTDSLEYGIVPNNLKNCSITPIHKGGSRAIAVNYRPVALISYLIKLFEKFARAHITQHMNENNV